MDTPARAYTGCRQPVSARRAVRPAPPPPRRFRQAFRAGRGAPGGHRKCFPAEAMRVPAALLVTSLLLAAPTAADASGRQGSRPARARRAVQPRDRQPPPRDVGELQQVLEQVMTPAEQSA